jgi:sugar phosphate isomerase/epimerase
MQTRRSFLRNAAALAAAAAAGPSGWALQRVPLGVQLFTVRKEAERNLPQVLDQIQHIGYQEVEGYAGIYTFSADALRHMVLDAGLRIPSSHFNYDEFGTRFNYASEMGLEWMVCPIIPSTMWGSEQGFATAAKQFNVWAKQAKDLGMRFAFHNHDYEFQPLPSRGTCEKPDTMC